jgi:hypothetical protein
VGAVLEGVLLADTTVGSHLSCGGWSKCYSRYPYGVMLFGESRENMKKTKEKSTQEERRQ